MYKLRVMFPAAVAALAIGMAFGYAEEPKAPALPAVGVGDVVYGMASTQGDYWFHQRTGDCAEASASIVIAELTGTQPSESSILAYATAAGYYTPGAGTPAIDEPLIMQHYGASATIVGNQSLGDMELALQAGEKVVAGVNGETIWNAAGYTKEVPGANVDHAVVVTAIDATAGTVLLTDTGSPTGARETVTIATFETAWATGGYEMVIANG